MSGKLAATFISADGDEFVVWRLPGRKVRPELYRTECCHHMGTCIYNGLGLTEGGAMLQPLHESLATPRVLVAMAKDYLESFDWRKDPPLAAMAPPDIEQLQSWPPGETA